MTALQMPSQAEVEAELTAGVRAALADGWTIIDLRSDEDELTFTMKKGTQIEAHVAHVDGTHNAYRVDADATVPAYPIPADYIAETLSRGGGLEIGGSCGMLDVRLYDPGVRAKGPAAAPRLVGALLRAADDLETFDIADGHAMFGLTLDGSYGELHVTLADDGAVVAAELRKYGYGRDDTTFTKQSKLLRSIGKRVDRIVADGDGIVLHGAKRYALTHDAFEANESDEEHSCGC